MTSRDTGYAADHWAFDEEVARVFDDMLGRSIPHYQAMRESVTNLGSRFINEEMTTVLDLGTSRGEQIARFFSEGVKQSNDHLINANYVGLEISDPMLEAASRRFDGMNNIDIIKHDLRDGLLSLRDDAFPYRVNLITAVLTMMFVPVDTRLKLLSDVYELLYDGGAFIMVEKMLGEGSAIDELLVGEYYRHKADMGYSNDDIERKRLSLQGVLVPSQPSTHIDNLKTLGFRHVDCFWRWMNFAGFIAVK
jgi:tRNA (cmo5U34)-methyltransferase